MHTEVVNTRECIGTLNRIPTHKTCVCDFLKNYVRRYTYSPILYTYLYVQYICIYTNIIRTYIIITYYILPCERGNIIFTVY